MRCNQVRYRVCKFTSAALRVIQHGLTGGVSAAKGQKHVRRHMCDNQHHCVCRWADVGTRFTPRCGPKAPKPPSHVLRTKLRKPHKMWLRIKAAGCNQARAASDEAGTRVAEPGKYQRRVCVMHLPLVWLTGDEDKSEDPQATTTIGATNPCGFCCAEASISILRLESHYPGREILCVHKVWIIQHKLVSKTVVNDQIGANNN